MSEESDRGSRANGTAWRLHQFIDSSDRLYNLWSVVHEIVQCPETPQEYMVEVIECLVGRETTIVPDRESIVWKDLLMLSIILRDFRYDPTYDDREEEVLTEELEELKELAKRWERLNVFTALLFSSPKPTTWVSHCLSGN